MKNTITPCRDCKDQMICEFEAREPCAKVIEWEALDSDDKRKGKYKPVGMSSNWIEQKASRKDKGKNK